MKCSRCNKLVCQDDNYCSRCGSDLKPNKYKLISHDAEEIYHPQYRLIKYRRTF